MSKPAFKSQPKGYLEATRKPKAAAQMTHHWGGIRICLDKHQGKFHARVQLGGTLFSCYLSDTYGHTTANAALLAAHADAAVSLERLRKELKDLPKKIPKEVLQKHQKQLAAQRKADTAWRKAHPRPRPRKSIGPRKFNSNLRSRTGARR